MIEKGDEKSPFFFAQNPVGEKSLYTSHNTYTFSVVNLGAICAMKQKLSRRSSGRKIKSKKYIILLDKMILK